VYNLRSSIEGIEESLSLEGLFVGMSLPDVAEDVEQGFDFVTSAGVAPTDTGNIPCYQIKLESALYLGDSYLEEVESVIRSEVDSDWFGGGEVVKVVGSKDILEEGTEREVCCFWCLVFCSLGTAYWRGDEYYVVGYSGETVDVIPKGENSSVDINGGSLSILRESTELDLE